MAEHEEMMQLLESEELEDIREGAYLAGEMQEKSAIPLLAKHIQSHSLGVQEAADQALRRIGGAEAVQAVAPLLRSDDAPVRNVAMDILREIGNEDMGTLIDLLRDEDPDMRIFTSDILGASNSRIAVDLLCDALLKDPEVNVRYQAAVSLGNLAFPSAANCLNKALSDDEWVQFAVIEALTKIRDESSVDALARALDSSSDLVASMIIEALGEMGNIKAVALLLRRIGNSATALRNKIVKAIVSLLGGKSLHLLPANEQENFREYALAALNDEDLDIQDAAIRGLSFVGGENASLAILNLASELDPVRDQERVDWMAEQLSIIGLTDALENSLRDGGWKAGMVAVSAMRDIDDPAVIGIMIECFWEKDLEMQRRLMEALKDKVQAEHRPFFLDLLEKHNDGSILKGCSYFLGHRLKSEEDGEKIFALLEHPYDDVKEVALDACINIGGEAMTQRFKQFFQSPDPIHRLMAIYALGKLGIEENHEELRLALEDEIPDIRKVAVESLGNEGELRERDLPMVAPRLNDENKDVRLAVVELLGKCVTADVTDYLAQALDDEDDWVRIRAVEALSELKVPEAIPQLVPLLELENKLIVFKVIEALGAIGGRSAFRALLELLEGDDPELQAAAEESLEKIKHEQEEE